MASGLAAATAVAALVLGLDVGAHLAAIGLGLLPHVGEALIDRVLVAALQALDLCTPAGLALGLALKTPEALLHGVLVGGAAQLLAQGLLVLGCLEPVHGDYLP